MLKRRATIKIRTWGGLGDVLLMTPVFRAIKCERPSVRLKVYCSTAGDLELLQHNPHIDVLTLSNGMWRSLCVSHVHTMIAWLHSFGHGRLAQRLSKCRADIAIYSQCVPMLTGEHATELIGGMLNVRVIDRQLEVFLTADEETWGRARMAAFHRPVIVQCDSRCSVNKAWPLDRWATLIATNPDYTFVQLGRADEPAIPGAVDLRGQTSIRAAIAMIKSAIAFVGVESFLAHVAHATATPSVVLFGPTSPQVWGHASGRVVIGSMRCAPCIDTLRGVPCPYGVPCMSGITVAQVAEALRQQSLRKDRTSQAADASGVPLCSLTSIQGHLHE